MRKMSLVLFALLLALPFAATANAQVDVGVGVGPAVVAAPDAYGPPACEWGYYSYYPYACAPYGYYGPAWFNGGIFLGVGPWYGWGWGHGFRGGYGYGRGPWSLRRRISRRICRRRTRICRRGTRICRRRTRWGASGSRWI